ncbi:hypothetical protein [Wohlfahrtiimonas larvae]|uniref:CsbD-like domain-containing protein n=1 Tax=Wohlfahrtiimonas larvae TaxID=1157986 RepID=A0ABP9MKR6_9GAMM|nr:hypothetical protein [Wohlfahrtiimonas larvae]
MRKLFLTSILSVSLLGMLGLTAVAEEATVGDKIETSIKEGTSSVAEDVGEAVDQTIDATAEAKEKASDVLEDTKSDVKVLSNDLNDKVQKDL